MYTPRYIFRLITAFFSRFKALILISVLFGVIIFLVLNFLLPIFDAAQVQRIGLVGRFTPSTLPTEVVSLIGNGLTKVGDDGQVTGDLAKSWEALDEGKTWKFVLDERTWQDGKKVTSEDIIYQLTDLTVEKPDSNTIIFKLQSPYSAFPSVVTRPIFKKGLLGTGEYKVKKIKLAGNFIESISLINENKDQKLYKFYPTEDRAKLAFKLGEVDILEDLVNKEPFDSWKGLTIESNHKLNEYVVLFFNTKNPKLADKTFRQALNYAIDKDMLSDNRALGPISKSSWAYNSQIKPYTYDLAKAKKAIQDLPESARENLSLNISTSSVLLKKAETIAKYWNEIGVKTNVNVYSTVPEDYEALLVIFDIPKDPDQYSIWHSTQDRTNISNLQNPRIDKLLEDGRVEMNPEERRKIYLDFQRFLVEEAPAVFLYYPENFTIYRR